MRAAAWWVSSRCEVESAMKQPKDEITLSPEEGEALLARLETETWTAEDRRVLG